MHFLCATFQFRLSGAVLRQRDQDIDGKHILIRFVIDDSVIPLNNLAHTLKAETVGGGIRLCGQEFRAGTLNFTVKLIFLMDGQKTL